MLEQIMESFFSKIGEKLVDLAHTTMSNIKDLCSTLDSVRRNLKLLIAIKSDIKEQIQNAELSSKKKRKRVVEDWLTEIQIIENEFSELENEFQSEGFVGRFLAGDRIAKLNERVDKLVEQSQHFGELVLDVYQTRGKTLLTTRMVGEAFEKNLEKILELLVTDKVSSIGVYGMGGVGKTTLTKHIYNRLLEKTQECIFWVTVSQEFSIKMLQDKIAHDIGLDLSVEHDEDKRASTLNQALSTRKKMILVLDDVWKSINLEKVGDPLRVAGCRLIITTRSLEVCHHMCCQQIIEVKTLHRNEAWDLFRETLGEETRLNPQVHNIAESMVKLCDGLPLGIITLAGSMRGETDIHVWSNALTELRESVMGQDEMEEKVFKVLKYNFDRLDPKHQRQGKFNGYTELQRCFLYCSLYPEDHLISRKELLKKFISEELAGKRKCLKEQLDKGHSILNKLVKVCLLENSSEFPVHDRVMMHDLVRAMALKITESESMVIAGHHSVKEIPNEEEWTKDLVNVSLMRNGIEEIPPNMSPNCPKLSTLLLKRNPLKFLPGSFFSRMHSLCILDLSKTKIKELPNSLSDLERLKVLLLEGCFELIYVPYLGKLKALRELDLSRTEIKEVPQGMEKLVNLKCLSMNGASYLEIFPKGLLLNFSNLQRLCLPYQIEAPIEEILTLKQLEEFEGRMKDMCDFNQFMRSRQNHPHTTFCCIVVRLWDFGRELFLSCEKKRRNKLTMYQCDLQNGEEKDVILMAQNIKHLVFKECEGLSNCLFDDFLRFNSPTSLQTLRIHNCQGIECILTYDQLMMTSQELLASRFQTLEEIELLYLPDFVGVIYRWEIEVAALSPSPPPPPPPKVIFSSLKRLSISHCDKMKKLGLQVSEFPNLEYISVEWCSEIEEIIPTAEGKSLTVVSLPKLKYFKLINLPRLKSICKETTICSSIEIIELKRCPMLKKLPLCFSPCSTTDLHGQPCSSCCPPPALIRIDLLKEEKEWWESLESDHPTQIHLLQPFLRFFPTLHFD